MSTRGRVRSPKKRNRAPNSAHLPHVNTSFRLEAVRTLASLRKWRPRRPLWLIGWDAARANAAPAFVLQTLMLMILLAYYFYSPSAAMLNALAELKEWYGLTFVLIVSAIVGAVLPEMFVIHSCLASFSMFGG